MTANTLQFLRKLVRHGVIIAMALGTLAGCASEFRFGNPPRVDRLAALKPGVSTQADILTQLGEPRGRGAMRMESEFPKQEIMYYEFTEANVSGRSRLKMLLVFVRDGKYDGHLWFSNDLLLKTEK